MDITKFTEKLNKIDNKFYTIEEEVFPVNGVYEADLEHDNVDVNTIYIYTGSMLTGTKINTYKITTPSLTPWRRHIKIYSTEPKLYIVYETAGDTIEADDINDLQDVIGGTQTAINEEINRATNAEKVLQDNIDAEVTRAKSAESTLTTNLNNEVTRATKAEQAIQANIDTNKPIWDDKYTKAEIDNKMNLLTINMTWKDAVNTYDDIATTYPTAQDGWTVFIKDTGFTYRYNDGVWVQISTYNLPLATASNDGRMSKEDKSFLDTVKSLWTSITTHISDAVKHITSAERTLWNTVSDKLDKSGGTVTGKINILGSAKNNPLNVRGINGIMDDGNGNFSDSDLYLNYNTTNKVYVNGTNEVYHQGNLTKVSQLTNDAGYITQADVNTSISPFYVATESSSNVYKITTGESLSSLKDGYSVRVAIPTDSTGNVSVTVDSVKAPIKLSDGKTVTDLKAGGVYALTYYNGNFICASGGKSVDTVTFTSDKLLTGYSANDSNGKAINGSMPNNGSPTATLDCGGTYNIQEGYYGGGTITANSLASQTSATATADKILNGVTAYVNGNKVTGTMANKGAYTQVTSWCPYNSKLFFRFPAGYYSGGNFDGDSQGGAECAIPFSDITTGLGITADKIVAGNTILGVTGTAGGKQFYYLKSTYAENSSITLPFNAEVITITIGSVLYAWKKGVALSADVRFHKVNASGGTSYHTYQYTTTNQIKISSSLAGTSTYEIFAYSV